MYSPADVAQVGGHVGEDPALTHQRRRRGLRLPDDLVHLGRRAVDGAPLADQLRVGLSLTPGGCQIGYMDRTGCHQLALSTHTPYSGCCIPGCQIGYMDHTGCQQLVF